MAKKITQGDGWKIISANEEKVPETIISKTPEQQQPKVSVEKRKKGKVVTLIKGLILNQDDLKEIAKSLKTACGTGGTVESGIIELQGDCQDKVKIWLKDKKFRIK